MIATMLAILAVIAAVCTVFALFWPISRQLRREWLQDAVTEASAHVRWTALHFPLGSPEHARAHRAYEAALARYAKEYC